MNISTYKTYIKNLAESNSTEHFLNPGPQHAAVVLSNLFNTAEASVVLYSGNLNGEISKDTTYQSSVYNFLCRGGDLKILLEDYDNNSDAPMLKMLKSAKTNHYKVIAKKHPFFLEHKETQEKVHFAVADGKAYRYEHDTDNYLATGSFNNPENAMPLTQLFLDMFQDAETIELF